MDKFHWYRWLRGGVWFFEYGRWILVHPDNYRVAFDAVDKGFFIPTDLEDHRYFRSKP